MDRRIDAQLAIVSESAFTVHRGSARVRPIEWQVLQIFASHFRRVVLVRPRVAGDAGHDGWVALPECVEARATRDPGDPWARAALLAGRPPTRLADLLADADVIYGRFPSYEGYHAVLHGKATGRPTLASFHGDWGEAYRADWSKGWRRPFAAALARRAERMYRRVGREADQLFCVGEALQERYAPQRDDATIFANYGIRADDLLERDDACAEPPYRILFVGSLTPRKGVPHLIDALQRLRERGVDVRLTLVGEGPDRPRYTEQAARLGIGECIEFAGYVDMGPELSAFYQTHDLFVLPSVGAEGRPKVVVESMARSCPVVATRVGSVARVIADGQNGLLVSPRRADELAGAIARLIDDAELRRRVVRGGLQYAASNTRDRQAALVGNALRGKLLSRFGEVPGPQPD